MSRHSTSDYVASEPKKTQISQLLNPTHDSRLWPPVSPTGLDHPPRHYQLYTGTSSNRQEHQNVNVNVHRHHQQQQATFHPSATHAQLPSRPSANYDYHSLDQHHGSGWNSHYCQPSHAGVYSADMSGTHNTYSSQAEVEIGTGYRHSSQECQTTPRASARVVAQQSLIPAHQQNERSASPAESSTRKRASSDEDAHPVKPKKVRRRDSNASPAPSAGSSKSKRSTNSKKKGKQPSPTEYVITTSYTFLAKADGSIQTTMTDHGPMGKAHAELQVTRCINPKFKDDDKVPKCLSCIRRWSGDTCRFLGIRLFLRDDLGNIMAFAFLENALADQTTKQFPKTFNVPITLEDLQVVKAVTARALRPVLLTELHHMSNKQVIYRPRESEVRATCDACLTSLFGRGWMCRICGREFCPDCYERLKGYAPETQQRGINSHLLLLCTKRNEHLHTDFCPVSRFEKTELQDAIAQMEPFSSQCQSTISPTSPFSASRSPTLVGSGDESPSDPTDDAGHAITPGPPQQQQDSNEALASLPHPPFDPTMPRPSDNDIPFHDIDRYTFIELTEEVFRQKWASGIPLLVRDLGSRLKISWTPEYLVENYGETECVITECQTEANETVLVKQFFAHFGKYDERKKVWKLKDWPPSTDFVKQFPKLYDDFQQAVPIPSYVRRDGVLNISSHFPANAVAPDLGPKMYNALASQDGPGSRGSTRLHMDISDALNILTYAAPAADGSEGSAAWDLFRAEDSDKIRQFLKKKFNTPNDPIHAQIHYLDIDLRRELWKDYGVKSYRVYQKAGEAIFIPAGVAHQVCNLADCVKVAVDFVSPENLDRCETLTREFREQNYGKGKLWKDDVLQLRTMMWYAWLSCCQQEKDLGVDGCSMTT